MKDDLAREILGVLESFHKPIALLEEKIDKIEDVEERRGFRRALGVIAASLEGDIAYQLKGKLGMLRND